MIARSIAWLLGLERVASVDRVRPVLGAEWATRGSGPFWLCVSVVAIVLLVGLFYLKFQNRGSRRVRLLLAVSRILLFLLLLTTLAEPVLQVTVARLERPRLFVVFDGTASMALRDQYDSQSLTKLAAATGLSVESTNNELAPTRQNYVAAWLTRTGETDSLLAQIDRSALCQLRLFLFDGQTDSRIRELKTRDGEGGRIQWEHVADQLSTGGQVTALGSVLHDLSRQGSRGQLAGIIMISDFGQNAGEHPLGNTDPSTLSPLREAGVPIYAIGVGAPRNRDLAVRIEPEAKIRRGEKTTVIVHLQQTDLAGETVHLRLTALPPSSGADSEAVIGIDERDVTLESENQLLEIPFLPQIAGELELRVEASLLPGEVVTENNQSARRIQVIDDFIRLLYVAYEPTWEWRFVKEVFHRDPAVGLRGFRTYLASSDPRVRQSNPLFLPTLAQTPKDFFATDVIFLDDIPQSILTPRFCSMLEQFVRDFGGGLVVIAGPRFGPQQLLNTPLAKMLPVIIDPNARLQDQREFKLQLSARANEFSFMQLDDDPQLNRKAWSNLEHLPWYQPVAHQHERAIVLAEHPTDTCLDGKTPQPLIAIRRYGAGEVVYLGFNETWRLRRLYGDKYYRRFWLPMIDRLGLSHALGARKRFVVRLDRTEYRIEDDAIVTVQAYDGDYQPLEPNTLDGESLAAEVIRLGDSGEALQVAPLRIGAIRPGVFETRFPVLQEGAYRIRVKDPLTAGHSQQQFDVTGASAEMRTSVRDDTLPRQLAEQSQGFSCALHEASTLATRIKLDPYRETEEHNYAIWKTPLWFIIIVSLMLGEWGLRKWIHLI